MFMTKKRSIALLKNFLGRGSDNMDALIGEVLKRVTPAEEIKELEQQKKKLQFDMELMKERAEHDIAMRAAQLKFDADRELLKRAADVRAAEIEIHSENELSLDRRETCLVTELSVQEIRLTKEFNAKLIKEKNHQVASLEAIVAQLLEVLPRGTEVEDDEE